MSVYYTSEELIDSVKRRISIPANQSTFTDADILAFADEETMLAIVPAIMSLHEDYLMFSEDVTLVSSQNDYVIPYRAVGNKLCDLHFIDAQNSPYKMVRSTIAESTLIGKGSLNGRSPYSYYIMNNRVTLIPSIGDSVIGALRFIYYIRPSALVASTEIGVITNINRATGDITFSTLPSGFSTSGLIDLYKSKSPHNILGKDVTVTATSSGAKTITIAITDIPSTLEVGDHVALASQCAIPQIPSDLHVYLAQKTAERILEAQGDLDGLNLAKAKSAEMEMRAGNIIDNRVEESPRKLINHYGPLRSGLLQRWSRKG